MKLQVLGSSSDGNCYLLTTTEGETLIIEAGVPYRKVARTLGRGAAKISGCIISHEHQDHSSSIKEMAEQGIKTYTSWDTLHGLTNSGHEVPKTYWHRMAAGEMQNVGTFEVLPFEVSHDVPCLGFLIRHAEMGTLAFITDTQYCQHKFEGIDYIMVEANYDEFIALDNIRQAENEDQMAKAVGLRARLRRLKATHMEINTTLRLLEVNAKDNRIAKVVLIHTSKENGNPSDFKTRAEQAAGCPAYNAEPGLTLELNKPGRYGNKQQ